MTTLIIGSTALNHWFKDYNRQPKDIDIAVDSKKLYLSRNKKVEFLYNPIITKYKEGKYLSPELILTLKVSHLFWNINWDKHMWDTQFLLSKGYKINKKICKELYKFWNGNVHRKRHTNFNMSKDEFFTTNIDYLIPHDDLHLLVNPNPTYLKVLQGEVKVSKSKLEQLNYEDKFNLFKEEVYVMGYERYRNLPTFRHVQRKMLRHYITQNAPFDGGIFVIENYVKYLSLDFDFIKDINSKIHEFL